jgi:hypothetical protein
MDNPSAIEEKIINTKKVSREMKTFNEFCSQLDESSLSRIKSKSDKGGMAVVVTNQRKRIRQEQNS